MKNLHPVIQRMICETAKMYAITEVDSYLHIDNFMSINKRKFKPNARVTFAERVIAEAATTTPAATPAAPAAAAPAEPPAAPEGIQRTWGQAFSDFAKGGFSGLTKGKSDIFRNYTLAMQNLGQMVNLINQHNESESPELLEALKKSLSTVLQELKGKEKIIKTLNANMQSVAYEKSKGLTSGTRESVDMQNLKNIDLNSNFNIYNIAVSKPQLAYILSKNQIPFDFRKDVPDEIKENVKKFATQYREKFFKADKPLFDANNIDEDLIYRYLKFTNRFQDAAAIGAKIAPPAAPEVKEPGEKTDPATKTSPMAKEHYELYLSGIITEAQYNKFKKKK
jgi:hypothetical protein